MTDYYKLFTDGSHSSEKNGIGIGGYLLNPQEKEILTFKESIHYEKEKQSFKAHPHEALALKRGLELALEQNIENLICSSDDKTLCRFSNLARQPEKTKEQIDQLEKYIKKNHVLGDIAALTQKFVNVKFEYIPRELNKKADKLSKFLTLVELQNKLLLEAAIRAKKEKSRVNQKIKALKKKEQIQAAVLHKTTPIKIKDKIFNTHVKENADIEAIKKQKVAECDTYLVFNAIQDKKKNDWLEVYLVKKTSNLQNLERIENGGETLEFKLLRKKSMNNGNSWRTKILEFLSVLLPNTPEENLGLMFVGTALRSLDEIFSQTIHTTDKVIGYKEKVQEAIETKNYVLYHHEKNIERIVKNGEYVKLFKFAPGDLYSEYNTEIKQTYVASLEDKEIVQASYTKQKEEIVADILTLHSEEYTLGKNPELESKLWIVSKEENEINIKELRKRSVTKFMDLVFSMEEVLKSFEEKRPRAQLAKETMEEVRRLTMR